MAEKVRIYQLAKDLNLDTKEMLAMLDDIGVEYKSHASSLEADIADTIRQLAAQEAAQREADAAVTASDQAAAAVAAAAGSPVVAASASRCAASCAASWRMVSATSASSELAWLLYSTPMSSSIASISLVSRFRSLASW